MEWGLSDGGDGIPVRAVVRDHEVTEKGVEDLREDEGCCKEENEEGRSEAGRYSGRSHEAKAAKAGSQAPSDTIPCQ